MRIIGVRCLQGIAGQPAPGETTHASPLQSIEHHHVPAHAPGELERDDNTGAISSATTIDVVTGSFGYIGNYITRRLLAAGRNVTTLTGHPRRSHPFGDHLRAAPFSFDNPENLARSLQGADTLFNTYWIRFPHGGATFDQAVENTRTLIQAAEKAGVRRIVHISVLNASPRSSLPYYRGKGLVEEAIMDSRLSYAIIRPSVVFGPEDILINNIAWLLRRFPVLALPGAGLYRLRPVFVADLAEIAVDAASRPENVVIDAVGPEIYSFDQLVRLLAQTVRSRARILHTNPTLALSLCGLVGVEND